VAVNNYQASFSENSAESLLAMPSNRQRRAMIAAQQLARDPGVVSDYRINDDVGRDVDHLLVDGFVLTYWIDHAVKMVMILEVEDTV
jgi:hypothetical protein